MCVYVCIRFFVCRKQPGTLIHSYTQYIYNSSSSSLVGLFDWDFCYIFFSARSHYYYFVRSVLRARKMFISNSRLNRTMNDGRGDVYIYVLLVKCVATRSRIDEKLREKKNCTDIGSSRRRLFRRQHKKFIKHSANIVWSILCTAENDWREKERKLKKRERRNCLLRRHRRSLCHILLYANNFWEHFSAES